MTVREGRKRVRRLRRCNCTPAGGGMNVSETLFEYQAPVRSATGHMFRARACGARLDASVWEGWLEFDPMDGGDTIRSRRETTQPNRTDAVYWASGLSPVYLEGALARAQDLPVH